MRAFLFAALLTIVALAPLPLGSNRPFFWSVTTLSIGVLFILWGISVTSRQKRSPSSLLLYGAIFFFFIAIFWAAIQQVAFAPEAWRHPFWGEASRALGDETIKGAISVNPYQSGTALMRLLSYGAFFWLSLSLCETLDRSLLLIKTVAIAGLFYSGYGLMVYFSGNETILWLDKWSYHDDLTSSFVNRNSFASYAGITLICSSALLSKTILGKWPPLRRQKVLQESFCEALPPMDLSIWLPFLSH